MTFQTAFTYGLAAGLVCGLIWAACANYQDTMDNQQRRSVAHMERIEQ